MNSTKKIFDKLVTYLSLQNPSITSNKTAALLITPIILCILSASVYISAKKPFWIDEIYTYLIVNQSSVSDIFSAIKEGCDQQPPLYALIVRAISPIIKNDHLSIRIPSIIGVCLMCCSVYYFARKYVSDIFAIIAALTAYSLVSEYAIEGRCYGLVLGCVAVSFLCIQNIYHKQKAQIAQVVTYYLSLSIGIALHYHTIFVAAAILVSCLIDWYEKKRLNLAITLPCIFSPLVLLFHISFIESSKQFVEHYWAKISSFDAAYKYYSYIFTPLFKYLAAGLLVYTLVDIIRRVANKRGVPAGDTPKVPLLFLSLFLILAVLPLLLIIISLLTVKIFVHRYVIWSIIAISILFAFFISRITKGSSISALVVVVYLAYTIFTNLGLSIEGARHLYESENIRMALQFIPSEPYYIVIADHHAYMENWFYSPPQLRERLVHLLSMELETNYTNIDTGPRILHALRRRSTINTPDYDVFINSNTHFILATNKYEWLVPHLMRTGYRLTPIFNGFNTIFYDVQRI